MRWGRLLPLLLLAAPAPAAAAVRSLTGAFASFADATAALPMPERVAAFRARFAHLFPAFYRPRDGRSGAEYETMIARALVDYPAERRGMVALDRAFPAAYERELARFQAAFPGFHLTAPVYLLHSLGEMDAGTRLIGRRRVLIFGVDGIARYDLADSLPMLLDHEFFHLAHARWFPGCFAVWCTLWREGLAVHASAALNPGASDRQLGLEEPGRLRPAVEDHQREAWCLLQAKLEATDRASNRLFFLSGGGQGALPARFGYYLGYVLARRAAEGRSLDTLLHLPMGQVRTWLTREVAVITTEVGGCAQPPTSDVIATS